MPLQVAEYGSPENCNTADHDSESLPLEELFTKILEIKKQRDEAQAESTQEYDVSPERSNRATLPAFESHVSNKFRRSSSKRLVGSSHSGFRSLFRKIKRLFHIPFRKSSKKKKSSPLDYSEDKNMNAELLSNVFQKVAEESGGHASVSCPLNDAARVSSSFSIPLSFHNHDREAQIFPFPFPPPFSLSDLEPAVLANYLTALDSVPLTSGGSPDIGLLSPLSFDTRAPEENHFRGSKSECRAKSGQQFERHRTSIMKSIKRAQSFSALRSPDQSIKEIPFSYRANLMSSNFSSIDLGNLQETERSGWRRNSSGETILHEECTPDLLIRQNVGNPRHLEIADNFSITFDIDRHVQSKKSNVRSHEKQEAKYCDMGSGIFGGSEGGVSDHNSDSGTVEEVVHGLEGSNFTTSPVASTFVFDKSLNTSVESFEGDEMSSSTLAAAYAADNPSFRVLPHHLEEYIRGVSSSEAEIERSARSEFHTHRLAAAEESSSASAETMLQLNTRNGYVSHDAPKEHVPLSLSKLHLVISNLQK